MHSITNALARNQHAAQPQHSTPTGPSQHGRGALLRDLMYASTPIHTMAATTPCVVREDTEEEEDAGMELRYEEAGGAEGCHRKGVCSKTPKMHSSHTQQHGNVGSTSSHDSRAA